MSDNRLEKAFVSEIVPSGEYAPAYTLFRYASEVSEWRQANDWPTIDQYMEQALQSTPGSYYEEVYTTTTISVPGFWGDAGGGLITLPPRYVYEVIGYNFFIAEKTSTPSYSSVTRAYGWEGSASSIEMLTNGFFEWTADTTNGAVVAGLIGGELADSGAPIAQEDTTHAIRITANSGRGVHYIQFGASFGYIPPQNASVRYDRLNRYRILRKDDVVWLMVLSAEGVLLDRYESPIASIGPVQLGAFFYASGDYIQDPIFVAEDDPVYGDLWNAAEIHITQSISIDSGVPATIPALTARGGNSAAAKGAAVIALSSISVTASGENPGRADFSFPAMSLFGGYNYAIAESKLAPLWTLGYGSDINPDTQRGYAEVALWVNVFGIGSAANTAVANFNLPKLKAVGADYNYSLGEAEIPVSVYGFDLGSTNGFYTLRQHQYFSDFMWSEATIEINVDYSFGFDAMDLTAIIVMDEEVNMFLEQFVDPLYNEETPVPGHLEKLPDSLSRTQAIGSSFDVAALLNAVAESGLKLDDIFTIPAQSNLQIATNAQTFSATNYSDFEFNSFAEVNGVTYGMRHDGIYILRKGDDDGATRDYSVDFGDDDFGSATRKNVDSIWFGLSSDGQEVFAKVSDDAGATYTYKVSQYAPTARAVVGRGITSRRWRLRLEVVDATEFDLDNVEFSIAASTRRRMP